MENEAIVEGKKKRPLLLRESQSQKKAAKMHPAVQLLNSLSTAVEHAASQKLLVKSKEIDERRKVAEAEANWKKRELDILKKKTDLEVRKSKIELNMLELQEKEQLLLTRKRLMDAGISIEEINSILPVNNQT